MNSLFLPSFSLLLHALSFTLLFLPLLSLSFCFICPFCFQTHSLLLSRSSLCSSPFPFPPLFHSPSPCLPITPYKLSPICPILQPPSFPNLWVVHSDAPTPSHRGGHFTGFWWLPCLHGCSSQTVLWPVLSYLSQPCFSSARVPSKRRCQPSCVLIP